MSLSLSAVTAFKAPLYVAWEITHRSNAKCLHCYSNSGPEAACSQDLSTEEAISVIVNWLNARLLVLAFSGGEPMLRGDWRKLVGHAVARGLKVSYKVYPGSKSSRLTLFRSTL